MIRIPAIEQPNSLFLRFVFWVSTRKLGKVITPLKVIYARKPGFAVIGQMIATAQEKLSLEPSLRFLVQVQASRVNGCAFCEDLALAMAVRKRIGTERFRDMASYRTSPLFSERERAALSLSEEATLHRRVSEETWDALNKNFTEKEIIELVWLNASENYFNLQAAVLGIESDGLEGIANTL